MLEIIRNWFKVLIHKKGEATIRHYFVAPVLEGVSEETIEAQIRLMKNLKKKIPQILSLNVGRNKELIVGGVDAILMTADFATVEDLEIFIDSPYHAEMFINIIEVMKIEEMVSGQVVND